MFVERRVNAATGKVELWWAKWEVEGISSPKKVLLDKIADEQTIEAAADGLPEEKIAICWAYGRTLGNIAVVSPTLLGHFPNNQGNNAVLPCDFVHAGKYRHGADRWWCRTHQRHWGTKSDIVELNRSGEFRCADYDQLMNYVVEPFTVNIDRHAEVGIWCSLPAAISTAEIQPRQPKIHVHLREEAGGKKTMDRDFNAISIAYSTQLGLFGNSEITRVNVTPPSAFDFVCAAEAGKEMGCINCSYCGYPHLDLGDFGRAPHRKHFCGNCGRDNTWSKSPIISTPLKPLHDRYAKNLNFVKPSRTLNLDEYVGCSYTVWASTPAIVWTADRPQEVGIHVHVHRGTERIEDETFGEVILNGAILDRAALMEAMIARSIT